jgi:phage/plasmid-associated DNA primase
VENDWITCCLLARGFLGPLQRAMSVRRAAHTMVFQAFGMCLRSGVDWRVGVFFIGEGLNGRGTVLELIRAIVSEMLSGSKMQWRLTCTRYK